MALALLRLDDSDATDLSFTVDTGTSTHFRLHLGKEVRREDGIDLVDGRYWSSPLQVNPAAGRHISTRTTYRLPVSVVRERGTLAQLESCRGPDGRGPTWSRPVRLPVAVPLREVLAPPDDGPRARARERVLTMSVPVASSSRLPVRPLARPRACAVRSAQEAYSRPASIADLIGSVVQAATPVVLDVLNRAVPGATPGSAAPAAAADPTAGLLSEILRTVLRSLAHPPAQPSAQGPTPAAPPTPVPTPVAPAPAPAAVGPAAPAPAVAKPASLQVREVNRFLPSSYARPMIFGIDDALIAAVAGPVLSSVVGPLVQALPQLLNSANAQKLARQTETDKHVTDLLSEVNRSLLMQQLISAQNQPVNPGVASSDLAAIGSLLQQLATAPAPAGTPTGAATGTLARPASVADPRDQPVASRAVLTAVTGPTVTLLGSVRVAFVQGQAPTLRYRLDVGTAGPSTALPRAILTLCVREPGGAADLCTRTERLTDVTPGQELKVTLTPEEATALPTDTDLEVLASLRWKGAKGTYQATSSSRVVIVTRVQVRNRGGVVGTPVELTDMSRFRGFWNQVWGSSATGAGGETLPLWGLDVALRYSVVAVAGERGNGLMEARLQQPADEEQGLRVRTRGRLKSGLEASVHELNKLLALWPGEQPLDEADLSAFTARGWLAGQGGDAVAQVRMEGKRGTRGVVWVVPVLRLREFTLATVGDVDPYGQVVATQDHVVRFPVVESVRVLGLTSLREGADPGDAADVDGAQDASGAPASYRFDGYDVVLQSLVGLEPAVPLPRAGG